MGIQTRRWARPRRRARFGAGGTLVGLTVCLFFVATLVRLLAISFDWAAASLLAVFVAVLVWVLLPTWR